jgi:hypothetical protein
MHIVKTKGILSLLRKPNWEEPRWILGSVMKISVFERNMMGRLDCFWIDSMNILFEFVICSLL